MNPSQIKKLIAGQKDFRALTLWRPWPDAILFGGKRIENRPWPPYRSVVGDFIALHAGATYDEEGANWMIMNNLFLPSVERSCVKKAIVGVARIVDWVIESPDPWFFGPYGWRLDNVRALDDPILVKGARGLWKVDGVLINKIIRNISDGLKLV